MVPSAPVLAVVGGSVLMFVCCIKQAVPLSVMLLARYLHSPSQWGSDYARHRQQQKALSGVHRVLLSLQEQFDAEGVSDDKLTGTSFSSVRYAFF